MAGVGGGGWESAGGDDGGVLAHSPAQPHRESECGKGKAARRHERCARVALLVGAEEGRWHTVHPFASRGFACIPRARRSCWRAVLRSGVTKPARRSRATCPSKAPHRPIESPAPAHQNPAPALRKSPTGAPIPLRLPRPQGDGQLRAYLTHPFDLDWPSQSQTHTTPGPVCRLVP